MDDSENLTKAQESLVQVIGWLMWTLVWAVVATGVAAGAIAYILVSGNHVP